MEFKLTYSGALFASQDEGQTKARSHHIHELRSCFHKQLARLWEYHPVLSRAKHLQIQKVQSDGFNWLPMVTHANGMICRLDILMLRDGPPGRVIADIDNRLKTLFDALRMPSGPEQLGSKSQLGQIKPIAGEDPFFVLVEDDRLITHVSVTTDMLLEPVDNAPRNNAVRLVLGITARPYHTHMENLDLV